MTVVQGSVQSEEEVISGLIAGGIPGEEARRAVSKAKATGVFYEKDRLEVARIDNPIPGFLYWAKKESDS